jgi:nitrogen fixation NifU-like protein
LNPDLRELYQDVILDHGKRPRNVRRLEGATHQAEGFNPLCGDRVRLDLVVEDGRIVDLAFQGNGCAISTASASMMTEALKGQTLEAAQALFARFHRQVTGQDGDTAGGGEDLGKLEVFGGVQE